MPFSVRASCAALFVCALSIGIGVSTTGPSNAAGPHRKPSPTPTASATPAPTDTPSPEPTPAALPTDAPDSDSDAAPLVNITVGGMSAPHRPPHESLFDFVGAPWECITFGGTKFTHDFSRTDDTQTILVNTVVTVKAKTLRLQEKFQHNPAKGRWNVTASGNLQASAPEWTGKSWTFLGTSDDSGTSKKIRMTFTMIGKDQYRRDFESLDGGTWTTYAGENCDRPL